MRYISTMQTQSMAICALKIFIVSLAKICHISLRPCLLSNEVHLISLVGTPLAKCSYSDHWFLGRRLGTRKMHLSPQYHRLLSVLRLQYCRCRFLVDCCSQNGVCVYSMVCCTLLYVLSRIVSEYDQEIPQSQTADNPMASRGRATQPSQDTRKTNLAKQPALSSPSR